MSASGLDSTTGGAKRTPLSTWLFIILASHLSLRCRSAVHSRPGPQLGTTPIETLLIDLSVRNAFMGTTRYLISYTGGETYGRLQMSGREPRSRRLGFETVGELARLAQDGCAGLPDPRLACGEDCNFWDLQTRINDQVTAVQAFLEGDRCPLVVAIEEAAK